MIERRYSVEFILHRKNKVTLKSLCTFCRINVFLIAVCLLPICAALCPTSDRVQAATQECFREYSIQKVYVDRGERRLYSGVDIEILRAYCSAYLDAFNCVRQLLQSCPTSHHKDIKAALTPFADDPELTELCKTHRLYELYAQYMICFSDRGKKSDWCFDKEISSSVMHVYQVDVQELCNRMLSVTRCIESNIRLGCGEQAADLVHLLVKPTVPGSGQCVYPLYPETTSTVRRNNSQQDTNKHPGPLTKSRKSNNTEALHPNVVISLLTYIFSIRCQIFNIFQS
ncbi:uncharacterized protein LOC127868688 isoform X2 [Dreissena polymorpha]|uniref:Uncharacterized protein n=1 Tax=Dreissena polymorpha TaxID=45954 RepID=A0A9D4MHV6_DREPO|nr:uncharacterized protein LOC127868688 isoform X2 [Dreissena polymorpha]KAH3876424.1 hypothetical protein DPMN_000264 [Dreissena polymorpha]